MVALLAGIGTCRRGVVTDVVVVLRAPETLPLVTTHDVEVVNLGEVLIVLCIRRQREVTLRNLLGAVAAVVGVLRRHGAAHAVLAALRDVGTKRQVQAQVLETVNLVVNVGAADEGTAVGRLLHEVEHGKRVPRGVALVGVGPRVVTVGTSRGPLEESAEVVQRLGDFVAHHGLVVRRGVSIRILRRVETEGCAHSTAVSEQRVGKHALAVEVQRQVVVEQRRVQVNGCRHALEVGAFQRTLLVGITQRDAVGKFLERARQRDVVVMRDGRAVNLLLPVGVGSTEHLVGIALLAPDVLDEVAILCGIHHVERVLVGADGHATGVRHLHALTPATFLRCDNDDTVRTAATVDGRGRGILQHVEGLDVLRVNGCEKVGNTLHSVVIHRHTINDQQRVVVGIQRRAAADADIHLAARCTVVRGDVNTSNLTL